MAQRLGVQAVYVRAAVILRHQPQAPVFLGRAENHLGSQVTPRDVEQGPVVIADVVEGHPHANHAARFVASKCVPGIVVDPLLRAALVEQATRYQRRRAAYKLFVAAGQHAHDFRYAGVMNNPCPRCQGQQGHDIRIGVAFDAVRVCPSAARCVREPEGFVRKVCSWTRDDHLKRRPLEAVWSPHDTLQIRTRLFHQISAQRSAQDHETVPTKRF
mmetsp:Transcript_112562/g.317926  ORF Transcript_112562/g.317926 Transcript_112562/m.317926 type:complete len:215 (-) Transcript_112562:209-853(-)